MFAFQNVFVSEEYVAKCNQQITTNPHELVTIQIAKRCAIAEISFDTQCRGIN